MKALENAASQNKLMLLVRTKGNQNGRMSLGEYIPPAELLASAFGQTDKRDEGRRSDRIRATVPAMQHTDE